MANFGFLDQMGWSARSRSGGWLKALEATMKASKFSWRKRSSMNSFAGSAFFENFQMARALIPGAEWVPAGPAGLGWWLMSSAMGILLASAPLYGLIGLWIQEPLPDRMKRLLPESSHDSTSGSIASRYSALYHSRTSAVFSELMAGVLPATSRTLAPKHLNTAHNIVMSSPPV